MMRGIAAQGALPSPEELGIKVKAPISTLGTATGEDALEILQIPDPVGHRILVALPTMAEQTAGGIIIPAATNERERAASVIGKVVAMGPDAYVDPPPALPENAAKGMVVTVMAPRPRFPSGPWCKVGDTILFSRYAGARFAIAGVEWRMLNDDEVIATIPEGAKVGGL